MKNYLKKNLPITIIAILALVPIIRWFCLEQMSFRFFDLNSTSTSFGQITGLLGMMLFSLNLIISNRNKFFDDFFSGMDHFYDTHKWLGQMAFSLLLFHPIFLVVKYLSVSVHDAAFFLIPSGNFANTMGIVALFGMILLLGITLYLKIKYHIWRFSHKFMVLVFCFAILHVILISSDVSRDLFLRYYILLFAFIGLVFGFYRSFLRIFFNNDYELKVKRLTILNNSVTEIELTPKEKIYFIPGQFLFIRFFGKEISSEPHPFSFSSAPGESSVKIAIKSLGDYTSKVKNIKKGTKAKIEGPYGKFYEVEKGKKEIWIAGGVGITPFLSMARSLEEITNQIDLYYTVVEKKELIFSEELQWIADRNKNFRFFPWHSRENGYLNALKIKELSSGLLDADIFICGPLSLMRALKKQFISLGVEKKNIHFEEFNLL